MSDSGNRFETGSKSPRHGGVRLFVQAVLFLLVVLSAELFCRHRFNPDHFWYDALAQEIAASNKSVEVLIIGSSRVAAAVKPDVFQADAGVAGLVENLGWGYSRMPQHYFGLRELFETYPLAMSNVNVFVEARRGMPSDATWDEPWYAFKGAHLLVERMRFGDLAAYMTSSRGLVDKARVFRYWLFSFSSMLTYRDHFNVLAWRRAKGWLRKRGWQPLHGDVTAWIKYSGELETAGGIRNEEEQIQLVRDRMLAREGARRAPSRLEDTVLNDLAELVKTHGGRVFLLDIPLSSIDRAVEVSLFSDRDRARFRDEALAAGIVLLPDAPWLVDETFPDLLHLNREGSETFSRWLAKQWVEIFAR